MKKKDCVAASVTSNAVPHELSVRASVDQHDELQRRVDDFLADCKEFWDGIHQEALDVYRATGFTPLQLAIELNAMADSHKEYRTRLAEQEGYDGIAHDFETLRALNEELAAALQRAEGLIATEPRSAHECLPQIRAALAKLGSQP